MLTKEKIVVFIPTLDPTKARSFYEGILGLPLVSQDAFALVFEANATMLRVTTVEKFLPQPFTILGWDVSDLDRSVSDLSERGVKFEHYGFPGQDDRGIWKSPNGTRIAWFKDPDGNALSLGSSRERK